MRLEEVEDGGLLVSWTLCREPPLRLTLSPCKLHRKVTASLTVTADAVEGGQV